MKCIEQDIEQYIEYLRKQCGLSISLHFNGCAAINRQLLKYNLHCNNYCMFLKSNPQLWQRCIQRQKKIYEKLEDGVFFGMCHTGVHEYVYPLKLKEKIIGFVSISGYRTDRDVSSVLKNISREYDFDAEELSDIYFNELKPDIPAREEVDTLIMPLCHMTELMLLKNSAESSENDLYGKIINYLNLHHTEMISIDTICKRFYCSRSSVSHMFRRMSGMSVREYITMLRMEDAKLLLKNTSLSIASISANLGFADSCYFTNVFRKHTGVSPLKYRKSF